MMNKNIWNLYKDSERGQKAIAAFIFDVDDLLLEKVNTIFDLVEPRGLDTENKDYFLENFFVIFENILADSLLSEEKETLEDFYNRLIDTLELSEVCEDDAGEFYKPENSKPFVKRGDYKAIASLVPELSLFLYIYYPGQFYPIIFPERFDYLISSFDVLGINLPPIPVSTNKRARLIFYLELCRQLAEFAGNYALSPAETCACLYDFAGMLESADTPHRDLPEPTNIWLTGGSKEDYDTFLKTPRKDATSVWTCNENTRRGDIIVMYVRSPHSCIQSVWRAATDGVFTPFNYYNGRTTVVDGTVVPKITLQELRQHEFFRDLPIVRKNFQGVNGVKLSAEAYSELQKILSLKGFDISILPQLYQPELAADVIVKNENDVEEKLLIPLLHKLGYSSGDWTRQLSQKAGRKEKAIPDFVFFPTGERHFQNAPLVIEAKYNMDSNAERTNAFNQALSYARMLKSPIFAICDRERIIVYCEKNNQFDRFNPAFEKHWPSLNSAETFNELRQLIGHDQING